MPGQMDLRIWDVEHGACAMLHHTLNGMPGRLAMIDSGDASPWTPSATIKGMNRATLDYLFITNADQDHMSDLQGLWDANISVPVWYRNPSFGPAAFEYVKNQNGPLTRDARRYLDLLTNATAPVPFPFDANMGGVTTSLFWNTWPSFVTTNDLSLVVFVKFSAFKILFPGDLEKPGWRALLNSPAFRAELVDTDVLVASHHGRESGYCADIFEYCHPQVVVMSDKEIVHQSQGMTQTYRNHVTKHHPNGVLVKTTGNRRHVLTTRSDGYIHFTVNDHGDFEIATERNG